ncbi:MAG: hypothetical protein AAB508_05790 [Patescibacteria group bacterium]
MKESLCNHLRGVVCTSTPTGEYSENHKLDVEGIPSEVPLCSRPTEGSVQKNHCGQYEPRIEQIIPVCGIETIV